MEKLNGIELVVIEDDPNDVELIRRALKKHNIVNDIKVLSDGAEALDYLLPNGKALDDIRKFIFLDLKLPKVNGIEVLEKIKINEALKRVPVVILSSSRENPDIKKCYALGANSYLVKPVIFEKFIEVVAEAGMYWLILNESPKD